MHVPYELREDKEFPVITVFLDEGTETVAKKFRCCVCGAVVFEYYTSVRMMVPGEVGYIHAPTKQMCKGSLDIETPDGMQRIKCKTKYDVIQNRTGQ